MADQRNPEPTEHRPAPSEAEPGQEGLSTPSMQSEEERAGVTPPPQTAPDEMD